MIWGFVMMLFGGGANVRYLYALAGSVIFSLYIVFDTWYVAVLLYPAATDLT